MNRAEQGPIATVVCAKTTVTMRASERRHFAAPKITRAPKTRRRPKRSINDSMLPSPFCIETITPSSVNRSASAAPIPIRCRNS